MRPLRFATALLCAVLIAAPALAGAVLERIRDSGRIQLGHRDSSLPFSYVLPSGDAVGYSIDICLGVVAAIERHLGRPLRRVLVPVTSANRMEQVESGAVDLECGSTTSNAQRMKRVAFTIPTFVATTRLMVPTGSPIREIWNTTGKTVVTTRGTTAAAILEGFNRDDALRAIAVEAEDHASAFAMLASGRADAFIMDDVLLASLRATSPDPARFVITGGSLSIEPLALMFPKNDPELKRIVDAEVKREILSGEIARIYARWFESPIPPAGRNLSLPMNFLLKDSFFAPTDWVPE